MTYVAREHGVYRNEFIIKLCLYCAVLHSVLYSAIYVCDSIHFLDRINFVSCESITLSPITIFIYDLALTFCLESFGENVTVVMFDARKLW